MNNFNEYFLQELRNVYSIKLSKYNRNLRRYFNTLSADVTTVKDGYSYGYNHLDASDEYDLNPTPVTNVIKSVIDTLISKIASTKVRPFFSPVLADFKTIKVLRQMQMFFDDYFDKQGIFSKMTEAYRDACIFDTGYLFLDPIKFTCEKLNPWQVSLLNSVSEYKKLTKALITFIDYPVYLLGYKDVSVPYGKYEMYFDTIDHSIKYFINQRKVDEKPYKPDDLPLIILHYTKPIKGWQTTSITDDLYNIQLIIDDINALIKEAVGLTPANMFFVPEGTNLQVENLNNRTGNIIKYAVSPNLTADPIHVATPAPIHTQFIELLESYIKKAYEFVGISSLSAQSSKPSGLDSGKALSTMENIESDRFNTQLDQVVRGYVDVAKKMINIFPEDAEILPNREGISRLQWKDVKKENDLITIQYSAESILSKDPATKLQQLTNMAQTGLIPVEKVASFMEMPDLTEAFTLATAAQDAVEECVNKALEEEIYEIPKYISYQLLEKYITTLQNQLYANESDPDIIKRLDTLDNLLNEQMIKYGFIPVVAEGPALTADPNNAVTDKEGNVVAPSVGSMQAPTATQSGDGQSQQASITAEKGLEV